MPQVPAAFPAMYGSYAVLKPLSEDGEWSVYLLALNGATKPWVLKKRPLQGGAGIDLQAAKADTKILARMACPFLGGVLTSTETAEDVGIVVEHVPGKSLAAICARAGERSAPFPPELGLVVAHDALSASVYFHDFEGASRVHGNVSPRTIIVGYSGEAKLAGYRPGSHSRVEADVRLAKDLKTLARIIHDLPLSEAPQALTEFLVLLLEWNQPPEAASAAVKGWLSASAPSADDRQRVAAWLEGVFPGERDAEAQERERLVAQGIELIVKASADKRGRSNSPAIGEQIGEYKIVKVLGEGGMGRVYEAEHVLTGKRVALKVLHPRGRTREIEERFRREAESISRIANSHVVGIEDFGASADGKTLYLAMELLRGESLDRRLAREGPFAPVRALRIAVQMCQALGAAHDAGVIHRDLKPGNLMLVESGGEPDFVKILDFGLARLDTSEASLTRVGSILGTLAYMAPEQGMGKPATPKIDIYAVGEILYEMLAQKLPHEQGEEILARKAVIEPTPILKHRSGLPVEISPVVMRALARDPEKRHATMAELGEEIEEVIALLESSPSAVRRPWRKLAAGGVVVLLLGTGSIAWRIIRNRRPVPDIPAATRPSEIASAPRTSSPQAPPSPDGIEAAPTARPAAISSSASRPRPKPEAGGSSSGKRKSDGASAEQLLQAADAAFDGGNRGDAVRLAIQALNAGGGIRAHLALASYYQSMRFYRKALENYQAALKIDSGNGAAQRGIKMVEGQLPPGL